MGALKSLSCFPFPLDIDVKGILNHQINYFLRKFGKQEISNKQDCWSECILILTSHEIAIICESQLKTQLIFQHPKKC